MSATKKSTKLPHNVYGYMDGVMKVEELAVPHAQLVSLVDNLEDQGYVVEFFPA